MKKDNTCHCYHTIEKTKHLTEFEQGLRFALTGKIITEEQIETGACWGTREIEECTCNGDRSRCNFYPQVRTKGK